MKKGNERRKKGMRAPIVAHISIVDDDPSVRETTLDLMQSSGFAGNAFASAEDFLASRALDDTACLILDVKMRGMGGVELQRQLRAKGLRIPIIFITADNDEGVRAQALKGGAIAFLLKPVNPEELFRAVHSVLNRRNRRHSTRISTKAK